MITDEEIEIIKEVTSQFLSNMTIAGSHIEVAASLVEGNDVVGVNIELAEPQFIIGQDGKTLLDVQRLLRMVLHKKIGKIFYIKLDVNHYQAKKIEHLKKVANEAADQVALLGQSKALPPMSSYERRIIHAELATRGDIKTQSQGDGEERSVVVAPK